MTDPGENPTTAETGPLPRRTNHPYDAPDAAALVDAVRSYLHDELLPRATGADRWLVRVAANALAIARRELELGPAHRQAHRDRLDALGVADDAALSAAIRAGDLDHRWDEVRRAVAESVADSLEVAHPGYDR